jgi:hypothetical protein
VIGQLLKNGRPVVELGVDGAWTLVATDNPIAQRIHEFLTQAAVNEREVGDTHLPPGVAVLSRAAKVTGLEMQLAAPLPDEDPEVLR